jgi:hypothetical protein
LVPPIHTLRKIRVLVYDVLGGGVLRHSVGTTADGAIGPQWLLLLVRGAVAGRSGLGPDQKNRERLQNGIVFTKLMNKNHPQIKPLLSDEHLRWTGR